MTPLFGFATSAARSALIGARDRRVGRGTQVIALAVAIDEREHERGVGDDAGVDRGLRDAVGHEESEREGGPGDQGEARGEDDRQERRRSTPED